MMGIMGLGDASDMALSPDAAATSSRQYMRIDSSFPWFYMPAVASISYDFLPAPEKISLRQKIWEFQNFFGLQETGAMNSETARICYLAMFAPDDKWSALPDKIKKFIYETTFLGTNTSDLRDILGVGGRLISEKLKPHAGYKETDQVLAQLSVKYDEPASRADEGESSEGAPAQTPAPAPQTLAPDPVGVWPRIFGGAFILGSVALAQSMARKNTR